MFSAIPVEILAMIAVYCVAPGDQRILDDPSLQRYSQRRLKHNDVNFTNLARFAEFAGWLGYQQHVIMAICKDVVKYCVHVVAREAAFDLTSVGLYGRIISLATKRESRAPDLPIVSLTPAHDECVLDMPIKAKRYNSVCRRCLGNRNPILHACPDIPQCWLEVLPVDDLQLCVQCFRHVYSQRLVSDNALRNAKEGTFVCAEQYAAFFIMGPNGNCTPEEIALGTKRKRDQEGATPAPRRKRSVVSHIMGTLTATQRRKFVDAWLLKGVRLPYGFMTQMEVSMHPERRPSWKFMGQNKNLMCSLMPNPGCLGVPTLMPVSDAILLDQINGSTITKLDYRHVM